MIARNLRLRQQIVRDPIEPATAPPLPRCLIGPLTPRWPTTRPPTYSQLSRPIPRRMPLTAPRMTFKVRLLSGRLAQLVRVLH
ncbi:unnamed protein product [Tuwongella immobilis]|uniref:Uncharacterized protein n=1 Tax=Tuwongella immobilis TaxID=692036 RepID=A0A6C2YIK2_9BACT|nr:unnamed protein product [Tuwongella immobilis]VTR97627.1 unnamed protein product [Tuwongella immobilis]